MKSLPRRWTGHWALEQVPACWTWDSLSGDTEELKEGLTEEKRRGLCSSLCPVQGCLLRSGDAVIGRVQETEPQEKGHTRPEGKIARGG